MPSAQCVVLVAHLPPLPIALDGQRRLAPGRPIGGRRRARTELGHEVAGRRDFGRSGEDPLSAAHRLHEGLRARQIGPPRRQSRRPAGRLCLQLAAALRQPLVARLPPPDLGLPVDQLGAHVESLATGYVLLVTFDLLALGTSLLLFEYVLHD